MERQRLRTETAELKAEVIELNFKTEDIKKETLAMNEELRQLREARHLREARKLNIITIFFVSSCLFGQNVRVK